MLSFLFFLIFIGSTISIQDDNCAPEDFLKTFTCIGGLADFVAKFETFNLTLPNGRSQFAKDCKVATDCFNGASCLHADRLQLFLDTFCSYSIFLETEFRECKEKMDARKESQCEKSFKSFFDNTKTEDVKCGELDESLKCLKTEVTTVCSARDAASIEKYLVKMSQGLSCDEVRKMMKEKKIKKAE